MLAIIKNFPPKQLVRLDKKVKIHLVLNLGKNSVEKQHNQLKKEAHEKTVCNNYCYIAFGYHSNNV